MSECFREQFEVGGLIWGLHGVGDQEVPPVQLGHCVRVHYTSKFTVRKSFLGTIILYCGL